MHACKWAGGKIPSAEGLSTRILNWQGTKGHCSKVLLEWKEWDPPFLMRHTPKNASIWSE
jgi:hypothetical protein